MGRSSGDYHGPRKLAAEPRPRTEYEAAFRRRNAIDGKVLPRLTAEDLKDLGVVVVGHHERCSMRAIAALRTDTGAKAPSLDAAIETPSRTPPSAVK